MSRSDPQRYMGKGMMILAWLVALGLLTTFFFEWQQEQINPNRNLTGHTSPDGSREVVLQRNRFGHYVTNGQINGKTVTLMLDTGATDVVVPGSLAQQLGLQAGQGNPTRTAAGTIITYSTKIDSLRLGPIHLHSVRASINPEMGDQDSILLGMSALKTIEFSQVGDQLTLRQRAN